MRKLIYLILVLCFNLHAQDYYLASYQQANSTPIEPTFTPVARVNIGAAITATDGYINWENNNLLSQTGTNYEVVGTGAFLDVSGESFNRNASIPERINSTDLNQIDNNLRYGDGSVTYTFPVSNDDYKVVIYGGDVDTIGKGKITINGVLKINNFNWAEMFGVGDIAALIYDITVTTSEIDVLFQGITTGGDDYSVVMAIEILKKD